MRLIVHGVIPALIAVGLYFVLANLGLRSYLHNETLAVSDQLENGIRWEFDGPGDLVGSRPIGDLVSYRFEDSILKGQRGDGESFLSLNLGGQRIASDVFNRLRARIHVDRAARFTLYHRTRVDGPILSTKSLQLDTGWQILELDLDALPWTETPHAGALAIGSPSPSNWGGKDRAIADLRVHPASATGVAFEVDWIELLPGNPMIDRIALAHGSEQDHDTLAPIITLPWSVQRPEWVLSLRDQYGSSRPSASLLFQDQWPVSSSPSGHSLPWSIVLAGMTLLLGLPLFWRTDRLASLSALLGLVISGGWLLSNPWADSDSVYLLISMIVLTAVAGKRLGQMPMIWGTRAAWQSALLALAVAALPAVFFWIFSGPAEFDSAAMMRLLRYLPWAALQQTLLCVLLLALAQRVITDRERAASLAAILFGLAHYPNFSLMVATLLLATVCLHLYRRFRALAPLIVLHAALGTLYLETSAPTILRSGRIGLRFFS